MKNPFKSLSKKSILFLVSIVIFFGSCLKKDSAQNENRMIKQEKLPELNELISIQHDGKSNDTVSLWGKKKFNYNVYQLENPFRIIIDLFETKKGSLTIPEMKSNTIKAINVQEIAENMNYMTRAIITFSQKEKFNLIPLGEKLLVTVDRATEETSVAEEENKIVSEDIVEKISKEIVELEDIEIEQKSGKTNVTILASGPVKKYRDFLLSNPSRMVLDISNIKSLYKKSFIKVESPEIQSVRLGDEGDSVRVIFDYFKDKPLEYKLVSEGNKVKIDFFEKKSTIVFPAEVINIDFIDISDSSRVAVEFNNEKINYLEREYDKGIKFVFPSVSLPARLVQIMDVSKFNSPVKAIRSQQIERDGKKDTEVVMDIATDTPFKVKKEGKNLFFDFMKKVQDIKVAGKAPKYHGTIEEEMEKLGGKPQVVPETSSILKEAEEVKPERILTKSDEKSTSIESAEQYFGRRMNLTLKDAKLKEAFDLIMEKSNLNIVFDKSVAETTIDLLKLEDVPWDQALEIILKNNKLGLQRIGDNIIRIATIEELRKERNLAEQMIKEKKAQSPLKTKTIPIKYVNAEELLSSITGILQTELEQEEEVVTEGGAAAPKERVEQLRAKRFIIAHVPTNSIIIRNTEEIINEVEVLIDALDKLTKQVAIEARIVQASSSFVKSLGIQWGGALNFSADYGNPIGLLFPNSISIGGTQPAVAGIGSSVLEGGIPNTIISLPAGGNASLGLSIGSLNGILDLNLRLDALENWGEGKTISSPKITVVQGKSATISTGTTINLFSPPNPATGERQLQQITANTTLSITPIVTSEDAINLTISATKNSPVGDTILTNAANTEVMVKSGNTTVIGGIYTYTETQGRSGIPFFSHLPLIGWLFRSSTTAKDRNQLLIFVTPTIVAEEQTSIGS